MSFASRSYDLVLFGATSFVGQILTKRLVERLGNDGDVTWAMAGRNADKLERVAEEARADVDRIVVDAHDEEGVASLAASTKVVISTVGPYSLYGSPLVAAVAAAGTDYCDLTGEPHWMRAMIDAHQEDAEASGARIVHACGFDSIPSDLGTWFLQREAMDRFGAPCTTVGLRVKGAKGGASGGTVASMMAMMEQVREEPELRKILGDPYALAPEGMREGPKQPNVTIPSRDELSGEWVGPFIMAATNTRVVQRTHALLDRPWGGDEFRYDEAMLMGEGPGGATKAAVVAGGTGAFAGLAALSPTRKLLGKFLPDPGEGPSPEAQEAGFFDVRLYGTTDDGDEIVVKVTGDRDPGYGSTAKMLAESALALLDVSADDTGGGFWTPTTAFGDDLIERLVEHAGLTFDVID